MKPVPLQVWLQAARPKTLAAGAVPVLMGAALAAGDGVFHAGAAALALAGALLIQIGTNYWNDYADCLRGADTPDRVGPLRATQAGLVTPAAMRTAALVVFALAALAGLGLWLRAGWPVLAIGAVSIACGLLYTAGPKPLAYVGLGDLFVFVFFGLVAVAGTYFVQARAWSPVAWVAGCGPGFLSVAILGVNNLRDRVTDERAGKRTLAVRFGVRFARWEYALCLLGAAAVPVLLVAAQPARWRALAVVIVLLAAGAPLVRRVFRLEGRDLNPCLGQTGLLLLLYGLAFGAGWLL